MPRRAAPRCGLNGGGHFSRLLADRFFSRSSLTRHARGILLPIRAAPPWPRDKTKRGLARLAF